MQPDFRAAAESIGCLLKAIREDDRIHRCATSWEMKTIGTKAPRGIISSSSTRSMRWGECGIFKPFP